MTSIGSRLCSAAVLLVVSGTPQWASGSSLVHNVGEIVARVQERYDATRDLTANVIQETTLAKLGKRVTAKGTVAFKKPGKMRWELANGQRETIVSDGHTLWIYRPEDQQVIRMPFDQAFRSQMPVSFLTGVGRIADDFVVHIEDGTGEKLRLRLEPKRGSADVGILWLEVDRATYDIIGAEVQDPLGNTSKLILENLRRNTGLDDRSFGFEIPPGVDVMDAARE
ncbi:MAG: outer-membrane lipoprotein carrier protein [Candidatus Binatia bacterium]|nr:MAG: outer-membrane lipoprotein carrier protein [Candidatus Binatia bacterium]